VVIARELSAGGSIEVEAGALVQRVRQLTDGQEVSSEYQQLSGAAATPEVVQQNREMALCLCGKPYIRNPALPALLPRLRRPTLLVWGREDHIIPAKCGESYHQGISRSVLQVIERCGHVP
jgi:pimeloyl-ACP methyl ester carboxylesterase